MNQFQQQALLTEEFLAAQSHQTDAGLTWDRIPGGKPTHSFYHGSAGIVVYYLELFASTGDQSYLDAAIAGGDQVLSYVKAKADEQAFITSGFYSGWPGYVFTLTELFKASGEERFKEGAEISLNRLVAQSSPIGDGIGWIEPIPFSDITGIKGEREVIDLSVGAAGAGLIFLYAHRNGIGSNHLEHAIKTADRLLQVGEETDDGTRWLMMVDMAFPFTAPNFAHGGAGVGYFLADLYRDTGDDRYLDAAKSAARYVMSRTHVQDDGFLVCHTEEEQPTRTFYLGVCHGPAGTGRLMYLLSEITGEKPYLDWLEENFLGLKATGAPEVRSRGLWQNQGQCCGDAGIGDYALYLYRATNNPDYLDFATRVGTHLVQEAETETGACWQSAEHRNRPDFLEAQTGYMQGAAGVGSFLLHLATTIDGKAVKIVPPDTPFPAV